MTKHKIDDLFHQKLGNSEFTPSPAAWSKLESQLAQKKKKSIIFWMSTAASVALLLTFGWFVWKSEDNILPKETIAQNSIEQVVDASSIDSVQTQNNISTKTEKTSIKESVKPLGKELKQEDRVKNEVKQPKKMQKTPVQKQRTPLVVIQQKNNLAQNDIEDKIQQNPSTKVLENQKILIEKLQQNTNEAVAINMPVEQIENPTKESKSIKLVYTLKPAISPEDITQQSTKEVKTSSFKKVMALAKNIKENPRGIGSLRNAKNNFLSFNKKKNDSK